MPTRHGDLSSEDLQRLHYLRLHQQDFEDLTARSQDLFPHQFPLVPSNDRDEHKLTSKHVDDIRHHPASKPRHGNHVTAIQHPQNSEPCHGKSEAENIVPAEALRNGSRNPSLTHDLLGRPEHPSGTQSRGAAALGPVTGHAAPRKSPHNDTIRPAHTVHISSVNLDYYADLADLPRVAGESSHSGAPSAATLHAPRDDVIAAKHASFKTTDHPDAHHRPQEPLPLLNLPLYFPDAAEYDKPYEDGQHTSRILVDSLVKLNAEYTLSERWLATAYAFADGADDDEQIDSLWRYKLIIAGNEDANMTTVPT